MHSLLKVAVGSAVLGGVQGEALRGEAPHTTQAPGAAAVLVNGQDPDAISLAQVLLTAVPVSLREVAVTNLPAVSSILWEEFLDDRRPDWFLELPWEIQNYLIRKFGSQSAWPTEAPASSVFGGSGSLTFTVPVTASATDVPTGPSQTIQLSGSSEGASQTSDGAAVTATATATATLLTKSTGISTASGERTSIPTSFSTSYTTAPSQSSNSLSFTSQSFTSQSFTSQSSESTSQAHTISTSSRLPTSSETSSSTPPPEAPASSNGGLSKNQKIGLGVGILLVAILAGVALVFGSCALLRRHKKKNVEGSVPPASPGFIPRFAFQERYDENLEHHTPLNRDMNQCTHDVRAAWVDEGVDPPDAVNPYAWNNRGAYGQASAPTQAPPGASSPYMALENDVSANNHSNVPVVMQDPKPIMVPALFHTHTSNRARGKRTSYTSLHSVAEVSEHDEVESPILGRHGSSSSPPRNLIPTPAVPAGAQIKRKPVSSPPLLSLPTSPALVATSTAAQTASNKLLRQTMPEHSGSSSSGLALTSSSCLSSDSSLPLHTGTTSPISPTSNRASSNPFQYDSYVEDYGPEYQNGYVDVDDGLYGGNTSLSQYPEPRRKSSKTEWPLKNLVGSHHRRKSSPLWERIYEE